MTLKYIGGYSNDLPLLDLSPHALWLEKVFFREKTKPTQTGTGWGQKERKTKRLTAINL